MHINELKKHFPDHIIIGSFFLVSEPDQNIAEMEIEILDVEETDSVQSCTMGFPVSDESKSFLNDWMEYKDINSCDCVMMGINHDVTPPLKRIGRIMEMNIVDNSIIEKDDRISADFICKKVHRDFEYYLKNQQ